MTSATTKSDAKTTARARARRRALALLGLTLVVCLGHALAGPVMIERGVAGALLAGGGGLAPVLAALGFLLSRLLAALALAALPAALAWFAWRR